jgi:hypothetical protein
LTRIAVEPVRIRGETPDRFGGGLDIPLPVEGEFFCHDGWMRVDCIILQAVT